MLGVNKRDPLFSPWVYEVQVCVTCAEENKMSQIPHSLTKLGLTQPDPLLMIHLSGQCGILHRESKRGTQTCWFCLSRPLHDLDRTHFGQICRTWRVKNNVVRMPFPPLFLNSRMSKTATSCFETLHQKAWNRLLRGKHHSLS